MTPAMSKQLEFSGLSRKSEGKQGRVGKTRPTTIVPRPVLTRLHSCYDDLSLSNKSAVRSDDETRHLQRNLPGLAF